jgi:hypothetical protein
MDMPRNPRDFDFGNGKRAPVRVSRAMGGLQQIDGYSAPHRYAEIEEQPQRLQDALDAIFADPDFEDAKVLLV